MKSYVLVIAAALVSFFGITGLANIRHVRAMTDIPASSNVALLPARPDVRVSARTAGGPSEPVTAAQALHTAESEYSLQDSQVDRTIGIVSATASLDSDPRHQNEPVWIVTTDVPTRGFSLLTFNTVYEKFCVVVDATTGKYQYAYVADPRPL